MSLHVYTFESLGDFLAVADIPKPHKALNYCAWEPTTEWHGASREEACDMARNGWADGRKNMVEAMAQARPSIALAPAFTMDVGGAYPIAALAAAGDPCSMVCPDPYEAIAKPIIRLAVNVWASCAYTPSEFTAYGAAVLSYIDAIESSGFRVELTMLCHCDSNRGSKVYSARVIIKRAEDPLDIDRATFCLTHVSMLRRIFFAHMQVADGISQDMTYCGQPANPYPHQMDKGQLVVPGINTIEPGSPHLKSSDKCAAFLSKTMGIVLADANIELPKLAFGGGSK